MFLTETKLNKNEMDKIRIKLGMPHMEVKPCVGRSGGLAMLWRHRINVRCRWMGRMHIDVEVTEADGFK